MIIINKDVLSPTNIINDRGLEAKIYKGLKPGEVYKIFRKGMPEPDKTQIKRLSYISHPNVFTPKDIVNIKGDDSLFGYSMDYADGTPLPFLRGTDINDLIRAARDISDAVNAISSKHFLIIDRNTENILFGRNFQFVDTYTYLYLKYVIEAILHRRNIKTINQTVLRGLIGFSYKKLIGRYLSIVDYNGALKYKALNPSDDDFVYNVLCILQNACKEDSLDEIKLKLLVPTYRV